MKKLLAILMAMAMLLSFVGCGEKEDDKKEESKPSSTQNEDTDKDSSEESELPSKPEKPSSTPSTNKKGADSLEEAIETFGDAFMDFDAKTLVTVIYGATDEYLELLEEGFAAADEGLKMTGYEMGEVTEITDEETIYEALVGYNADIDIADVDSFVEVEIIEEWTMGDETEELDVEVQCVEIDGRWFVIFDD